MKLPYSSKRKEGKEYVAMQADLFYPKENIKGYTYIGEYAC